VHLLSVGVAVVPVVEVVQVDVAQIRGVNAIDLAMVLARGIVRLVTILENSFRLRDWNSTSAGELVFVAFKM